MNKFFWLLCCSVPLLVACADKTDVSGTWKDESNVGKVNKVFILAVFKEPVIRRSVEYGIVNLLNKDNLRAIPTIDSFPNVDEIDKTLAIKIMQEFSIDSVLLVRLVDRRVEKTYVSETPYDDGFYGGRYAGGWHNYYGSGYNAFMSPGYVTEEHISTVETAIYDITTDKLWWTTLTETTESSVPMAIASYLKTIDKSLAESNLF